MGINKNDKGLEEIIRYLHPTPIDADFRFIYKLLEGNAVVINKLIDEVILLKSKVQKLEKNTHI